MGKDLNGKGFKSTGKGFKSEYTVFLLIVRLLLLDRPLLINRPPRGRLKNRPTGRTIRRNTVCEICI